MFLGNSYIYTANATSQLSAQIQTSKVRIAVITPIAITLGTNGSTTATTTTSMIISPGQPERSLYVGQGNYIAYINIGTAAPQPFSITELGAAHANSVSN